jgi:hypothetical protein
VPATKLLQVDRALSRAVMLTVSPARESFRA